MDGASPVHLSLLGLFRVEAHSETVLDASWPYSRARALLKYLALAPRRTIRRERVVTTLWPSATAAAASNNLRQTLHQLRSAFAARSLVSPVIAVGDEALTLASHVTVDVDAFRAEARQALEVRTDPTRYEAALAHYGGDLVHGDVDDEHIDAVRRELADLRVRLLIGLMHAEMARGHDAAAGATAQSVLAADPAHEQAHRALMRMYARSGQRDRALRQYERCAAALRAEFGIEPDPATAALYREIVEGRVRVPAGAAARGASGPFVGREPELETLRAMLEAAFEAHGGVALIAGEPGIGKTRLVEEFIVFAELRGARLLWGRCYEHDGAPAFWPWEQVLSGMPGDAGREAASGVSRRRGAAARAAEADGAAARSDRVRVFERIAASLRDMARAEPLLIALGDVHRADAPSLLLLQFLAHELRDARVLIVATFRDTEVGDDLRAALAELARDSGAMRIDLTGLSRDEICRLVEIEGAANDGAVILSASEESPRRETGSGSLCERLHVRSEGNPLFLRELLRDLTRQRDASSPSPAAVPATLRDVIESRISRLPAEARSLLETASVIGRDVDLDILAAANRWEPARCLAALTRAAEERLVAPADDPGRYRFAHALFVEVLYACMRADVRGEAHRNVGEAIARLRGGQIERHVAALANHFYRAWQAGGEAGPAVDWAARAAERDSAVLAYEDAVQHYQIALEVAGRDAATTLARRAELLLALADAANRAGNLLVCNAAAAEAAALARQMDARETQSRATLLTGPRTPYGQDGTWAPEDVARLDEAIAAWGDEESDLLAMLLSRRALAANMTRDGGAPAYAERALAMARRAGDPSALRYVMHHVHGALFGPDYPEQRVGIARELVESAHAAGDREMEANGLVWLFTDLLEYGEIHEATAVNARLMELAGELRQPFFVWYASLERCALETLSGRFNDTVRFMNDAIQAGRTALAPGVSEIYERGIGNFAIALLRGGVQDEAEFIAGIAAAFEEATGVLSVWAVPVIGYVERGEPTPAMRIAERVLEQGALVKRGQEYLWLFAIAEIAEACVLAGERRWLDQLYGALLPHETQCVVMAEGGAWRGAVTHYLGMLATALGRYDDAERHLAHALAVHERAEAPPFIARTRYEQAKLYAERRRPGDIERARQLLASARATALELAMAPLAERTACLATALEQQAELA